MRASILTLYLCLLFACIFIQQTIAVDVDVEVDVDAIMSDSEFNNELSDVTSLISSADNAALALDSIDSGSAPSSDLPFPTHGHVDVREVPANADLPALIPQGQLKQSSGNTIKMRIKQRKVVQKPVTTATNPNEWNVPKSNLKTPLVDRGAGRKRSAKYTVVASLDGAGGKQHKVKPHSQSSSSSSSSIRVRRNKRSKSKKSRKVEAAEIKKKKEAAKLLAKIPDKEDEITRLDRLQKRMARLVEHMTEARPAESLESALQRKHRYLNLYQQMKQEAKELIESYALRTGSDILGNGPMDPALKAMLPPTSLPAIIDHYTQPSNVRDRESPKDVISFTDAQRIQFKIDTFKAHRSDKPYPQDPFAPPFIPRAIIPYPSYAPQAPGANTILARQEGDWGNGRPVLTTGQAAGSVVGDVHVHLVDEIRIPVVSNSATQNNKPLPFNVTAPVYDSYADRLRWTDRLMQAKQEDVQVDKEKGGKLF